ncbi:hypothetical protein [Ramlibacter sp. AN1133]|uniref:hypothetical protein n=1 Tax=Ramlibacter sp. AN1133 TaxID=3133429 RepID=UPI0030BAD965
MTSTSPQPVQLLREIANLLESVRSAIAYTHATISPGCQRNHAGDWVEVHRGRANSAFRQLEAALQQIDKVEAGLRELVGVEPTPAAARASHGCAGGGGCNGGCGCSQRPRGG